MRPSERQITAVLKSRGFTWLLIVTSLVMGWVAYNAGIADEAITVDSMWLPDPERWIASRWASVLSSIVLTGGCCILMAFINKVHNLMRTVSLLFVGLFTIMLAATPKIFIAFGSGTVLAFAVLLSIMLLYSIYDSPDNTRRLFMVFFILSCGAVFDYAFVPYIAVFIIGARQMKCLDWRSFLAAVIGVVTPLWILLGGGLLSLESFRMPDPRAVYEMYDAMGNINTFVCVGMTMALGLILGSINLMKIIAFNARRRAMVGFMCIVGILSGLLCIVDFTNIWAYLTLLYVCVAFQVGLFMRLYEARRAYIAVLAVMVLYLACFVWTVSV